MRRTGRVRDARAVQLEARAARLAGLGWPSAAAWL